MTKKKPKRAAKPRPLCATQSKAIIACVSKYTNGKRAIFITNWGATDANNARRLNAWLPGAIAWCEDGSVAR